MNRISVLFLGLLLATHIQAQVIKTVDITAGTLSSALTALEKTTITDLTITGTIDARDFKTMRDSMDVLANIDLDGSSIVAYTGLDGTNPKTGSFYYGSNTIPEYAFFYGSTSTGRLKLKSINLNRNLENIFQYAFFGCENLTNIVLDESVRFIANRVFYNCKSLVSISLPSTIRGMGSELFSYCESLTSIYCYNNSPEQISISSDTFKNFWTQKYCRLHVPFGNKALCRSLAVWNSFLTIEDDLPGFEPEQRTIHFIDNSDSTTTVFLKSNVSWSVSSNNSWLSVTPTSGENSVILLISFTENLSGGARSGEITISSYEYADKTITVTQEGLVYELEINAGELAESIPLNERNDITKLKVMGTVDARDFKTMRDSLPSLAVLDLGETSIAEYTGTMGTYGSLETFYAANEIPFNAFDSKTSLVSAVCPMNSEKMDTRAFYHCSNLLSVNLPEIIETIGDFAFHSCNKLAEFELPASLKTIGQYAFAECYKIDIDLPDALSSIGARAFYKCSSIDTLIVPSSLNVLEDYVFIYCSGLRFLDCEEGLKTIGEGTFAACSGLKKIKFNNSLTSIRDGAFSQCLKLDTIDLYQFEPLDLSSVDDIFQDVDSTNCILFVPHGTKGRYSQAIQWKDFNNIIEKPGFLLYREEAYLDSRAGNSDTILIFSDQDWTVNCDQSWLSVTPVTGYGDDTLVFHATTNLDFISRKSHVTVSVPGIDERTITVFQEAAAKTIQIEAGGLSDSLTSIEKTELSDLTIKGTMDARDFKTLRDSMPSLKTLDIADVNVVAYTGTLGTAGTSSVEYDSNTIPRNAFFYSATLEQIKFPLSLESIDMDAFHKCMNLNHVEIPNGVHKIEVAAFYYCTKLSEISLPNSILSIGFLAFASSSLEVIYSYPYSPVDLSSSSSVFSNVDTIKCKLYVPFGSKSSYEVADQWQNFQNIIEMPGLILSDTLANVDADGTNADSAFVDSNTSWVVESDQSWLTVNRSSGSGSDTLVFVAEVNPNTFERKATVTISGDSIDSQTVIVTQQPATVAVDLMVIDSTLQTGNTACFDALNQIAVAGIGTTVELQSGSASNFIAGQSIVFLPGFHAWEGSQANATITQTASFCDNLLASPVVQYVQEPKTKSNTLLQAQNNEADILGELTVKVYPNPNNGRFTLSLDNAEKVSQIVVINNLGSIIFTMVLDASNRSVVNLPEVKSGIYFIKVVSGRQQSIAKFLVQ